MPNNSTKILLLTTLTRGILISISSNSWFGAWIGLEINLLSFIPIMVGKKNIYTTEASLKYFIVQAGASSILLFMVIIRALEERILTNSDNLYTQILINTPLLLKGGVAPIHWWFPGVIEGLNWDNCLILITLQKAAPLSLISYQINNDVFLGIIIISSVIIGAIGGLNQTSLRKIITYSSINHTGWIISAIITGSDIWVIYFTIYSILTLTVVSIVKTTKLSFINQIALTEKKNKLTKFLVFTRILSLGGLPPFLGFIPKWIIIQTIITNDIRTTATIIVLISVVTLYYYIRISYSSLIILHSETKWLIAQPTNKIPKYIILLTSVSVIGLIISETIIT